MPTTFSFGIDWQRKGLICWDARPGDALNVLPRPMTYSALDFRTSGVVTSTALARLATPYGIWAFTTQTGTGANNGFTLGQSNALAVNTIPAAASAPYGVDVWVRGQTGFAGVPFILRVRNQAGTTLFSSSAFNLTADWQRVAATGTTVAGTTHLIIEVIKNGSAADVTFQTAGSTVPTGYNAGHASNLFDNVTERVKEANWFLGMRQPWQDKADSAILDITLDNADKVYSPDSPAPALIGKVVPQRPVRIQSSDGTTTRLAY
jgi:hypothetical protein